MKNQIVRIIVFAAIMLGLLCVTGAAAGPSKVLPAQSHAYGKSLTEWTELYWRWTYTGWTPGTPAPSVPFYIKPVALMPIPAGEQTGGNWTPDDPAIFKGQIEVTLEPGTPFVLPLFAWILERYDCYPGCSDDSPLPKNQFVVTNPNDPDDTPVITLDGQRIVTNFWDYYVEDEIDPPAFYAAPSGYGSIAAVGFQGATIVVAPLTPGTHVLTLYEKYVISDTIGLVYDNTWTIHVKKQ